MLYKLSRRIQGRLLLRSFSETTEQAPIPASSPPEQAPPRVASDDQVELLLKLEASKLEVLKYKDLYVRSLAEQESLRKRLTLERENEKIYAISSFSKELLEVSDSLCRALASTSEGPLPTDPQKSCKELLTGVTMTKDLLLKVFGKFGLEEYNSLNQKFDTNLHKAVFTYPDTEKHSDTIGQVVLTGFTLNHQVLRAAQVGVVKNTNNNPEQVT